MFQTTIPYKPEQKGEAKRKNQGLCKSGRNMLFNADWGKEIMTACYLSNRVPDKAIKRPSQEQWNKKKNVLQHIRIFGSKAFVYFPKEKHTKGKAHAKERVLVG